MGRALAAWQCTWIAELTSKRHRGVLGKGMNGAIMGIDPFLMSQDDRVADRWAVQPRQAGEPVQGEMRRTDCRSTIPAPSTLVPNQSTHSPIACRNSL